MQKFNLIEQPWIETYDLKRNYKVISLADLITNAHQLTELGSTIPIVNSAIFFLLETLIVRILTLNGIKLDDMQAWIKNLEAGKFNGNIFNDYFNKWHDRFYLFDDYHPFFQEPIEGDAYVGSSMKLMPHFSGGTGGNSSTLFDHRTEEQGIALTPAQAARFLLPAHYYGAGGRVMGPDYFSDSPMASGMCFMVAGNNLFDTLALNIPPYPDIQNLSSDPLKDKPNWEREHPFDPSIRPGIKEKNKTIFQPLGLMDYLTWPDRRIQMIQDDDQNIRKIKMRTGLQMAVCQSPYFAYNEKGNYLRPREERAVWRDCDVLLEFTQESGNHRPPVSILWLKELIGQDFLQDRTFTLKMAAMAKDPGKQKAHFYSHQSFPLPASYLMDINLLADLKKALRSADAVGKGLFAAFSALAESLLVIESGKKGARRPDPTDVKKLREHLSYQRMFWAKLDQAFDQLILNLPRDRQIALDTWGEIISKYAWESLEAAIQFAGNTVHVMKGAIRARNILGRKIKNSKI